MVYHQCKCGNRTLWESGMYPKDCEVCSKCGSTFGTNPHDHPTPIPHDFQPVWAIKQGQPVQIMECTRCHERKEQ